MKKWAMWSLSLSLSVSLGCNLKAESSRSDPQTNPSAQASGAKMKVAADEPTKCIGALKCQQLDCTGNAVTRHGLVVFGDNGIVDVTDTICACVGDTIEWKYDNLSKNFDKDVRIKELNANAFLEPGECKNTKTVKKEHDEKAPCAVKKKLKNGCYGYEIKGTHEKDPEVEVQGGDKGAGSPGTSSSPSPGPSPIP